METLIRVPLISSALIIQIFKQRTLSPESVWVYLSECFSVRPFPPLQHIGSRRHKDRAAGKPAKPKFSPYTPTQHQQGFQAVSTRLLLDSFSSSSLHLSARGDWHRRAQKGGVNKKKSRFLIRLLGDNNWDILSGRRKTTYWFISFPPQIRLAIRKKQDLTKPLSSCLLQPQLSVATAAAMATLVPFPLRPASNSSPALFQSQPLPQALLHPGPGPMCSTHTHRFCFLSTDPLQCLNPL